MKGLRDTVSTSTAKGWGVRKEGEKVRLEVRGVGSVVLPFLWEKGTVGDVHQRVRNIYGLVQQGHDLKAAAAAADKRATTDLGIPWREAAKAYEDQKRFHGRRITAKTWRDGYGKYLEVALTLLEGSQPPMTCRELIRLVIESKENWLNGPSSRQDAVEALSSFAEHCIETLGLNPASWLITPQQRKTLKGPRRQSRDKAVLPAERIVELVARLEEERRSENRLWAKRIRLMALYGLRPIELNHLQWKRHPGKEQPLLWCSYEKVSGEYKTKPRWLLPCPITGTEHWPEADIEDVGGIENNSALTQFLSRKAYWRQWKEEAEARNEWLRAYTFRDSYSFRSHELRRPVNQICLAMGHSLKTHVDFYVWAKDSVVLDALGVA